MYQKEADTDGCWHSSTGVSPRPMLVGAARNALRAFNARVSLTYLYVVAHKLPHLFFGLVWIAHLFSRGPVLWTCNRVMAHRPTGSAQTECIRLPFMLHRRPPTGLSLSKCSLQHRGNGNRESCFRYRGRIGQFMLTIEWMSLISSRRFMYSSTRTRGGRRD